MSLMTCSSYRSDQPVGQEHHKCLKTECFISEAIFHLLLLEQVFDDQHSNMYG